MRTVVGILRGGTSSEYPLSIKTGGVILRDLPEDAYEVRDILVDRGGYWHMRGIPANPTRVLAGIDVVINALHGGVGEDGSVQRVLDSMSMPYTGSRALSSGLSLNKIQAKRVFASAGLPQARGIGVILNTDFDMREAIRAIFAEFGPPYIVKPPSEGASFGIRMAPTILELPEVLADVLDAHGSALVEEYLRGEEARVGIIEHFRGQDAYALPPSHVPVEEDFLAHPAHEAGTIRHAVPSHFSPETKRSLEDMAKAAHKALGLSHFSCADFIVTSRGPMLLEVNAIPGLYEGAAFPPMLEAVGSSNREFLEHAIALARK